MFNLNTPDNALKVSVIIPCYNAIGKIEKCLRSINEQTMSKSDFEVIFVDDCSTDATYQILKAAEVEHPNWHVYRLENNSGSPSKPRNFGLTQAVGQYVFYLDCDDELLSDTLEVHHNYAIEKNACIVRGCLIVNDGKKQFVMNRLLSFDSKLSKVDKIRLIMSQQSTTVCQMIRRDLLVGNKIAWPEKLKMGEDTLFLIDVFIASDVIEYIDHSTFIYNKEVAENASSTQQYGAKELSNHLQVWGEAETKLNQLSISYVDLRLRIGLQSALQALIKYYTHDINIDQFRQFSDFTIKNWSVISNFTYSERLKKILKTIHDFNYIAFINEIKPRLLIAGYDLKFIQSAIPHLEKYYQIRVDTWTGHDAHNEKVSVELLNWTEIIFCEWLLGNAAWYSKHKKPEQKLVVRMHRFELTTDWYLKLDDSKVDHYIVVSVYFAEKLIEYLGCARGKVKLVPNFIDVDEYEKSDDPKKVFNLGIIGILPYRKGYLRALQVLNILLKKDNRYNLSVYGKMPSDLPWIKNNPEEMKYFSDCDRFINDNALNEHVDIKGWVEVKTELKDVGFILSTSHSEEIFESFHIAPADGFAAGGQGVLLNWNGVEFIYPQEYIFETIEEIASYILKSSKLKTYNKQKIFGYELVKTRYSANAFVDNFRKVLHF